MDSLSLSLLLKFKRQKYDLLEPESQDFLVNFDIGESKAGQSQQLAKAQDEAPK